MKNKFAFFGIIFVMFMIMGCFTTPSSSGNRQETQRSNSQSRVLDPTDVVGKNLIGTDESGTYSFLLHEDGNLEYTVNGTVNTGNWTFNKFAKMYRYVFNWTEDGKEQGYIMDFLADGAEITIMGHWYVTDTFKMFMKKVTIEENVIQSSDQYYSTDYLTIIAIPQLATGSVFDDDIISEIFMEAVTGGVMNLEGDILDHVKLCDIAFNKTDKKELSIVFGDNHPAGAILYGKRLIVIFEDNMMEYILLDASGKVIYDPGDKYTDDKSKWKEIEDIYIYTK